MKMNGLPFVTDQYTTVPDGKVVMTEPPKPENVIRLMTIDEIRKILKNT